MKKLPGFISLLLVISNFSFAQVGINNDKSAPDPSAGLDVKFSDKGFLPPRMTLDHRNAIASPADGLIVYCTDCGVNGSFSVFSNGVWRTFAPCITPSSSPAGSISSPGKIFWKWTAVAGASGYKWNTTMNYSSATDMATDTLKTETGLSCDTTYTRYVWVYSECGISLPIALTQIISCLACGDPITVHHQAGEVAPVNKITTYGTVTNIPGETTKCWITSNLGSDHQAAAVDDGTEASAGWYWKFNRKQGYKHDGSTRTPNTDWITNIDENSDWETANDPCNIELGSPWRIPTYTEWNHVDNTGGWTTWTGPWSSGLKLHAAGYLRYIDGSLDRRGSYGYYWSGTQFDSSTGRLLGISIEGSIMFGDSKDPGFAVRCIRDH